MKQDYLEITVMRKIGLLCCLLSTSVAHAINKCPQPNGRVLYSDMPCPENIDRNIRVAYAEINRLENQRETEIDTLRNQGKRANNNLAGATYLNALAQEQNAVAMRYNNTIQQINSNILSMRDQRKRIEDRQ